MSVFSNPASRSAEQAAAYTSAVLELVGTRDPVDILGSTAASLRAALDQLSAAQLNQPEAAGKWSIRHVVQHLADSELVWGFRLRMALAHDRPPLMGYDQDLWAERLRYDEADANVALHDFEVLREANLRLLHGASPADFSRVAVHAERGEESVAHMVRLYAGHDVLHLRQIDRIHTALSRSRSAV